MVDLSDVSVEFEDAGETVHALSRVSMKADAGTFTWIGGPSGSGKSTLLGVISGLLEPKSGRVCVRGIDLAGLSQDQLADLRLKHVGVVFQENNLIKEFSAGENVELPLRAQGVEPKSAFSLAMESLGEVGLGNLANRMPAKLSGGQRQRVGIARALVGGRSVLVADEPTGSLDSANSRGVFGILREAADRGVCVIVASHDLEVRNYADRFIQMRDGVLNITDGAGN
ncbi:MAG: ABC transporter ATP-binding protein [Cryobacterium sp.]|nr:ABC transporter ATP-binding protein [Cryobacterium sp.]